MVSEHSRGGERPPRRVHRVVMEAVGPNSKSPTNLEAGSHHRCSKGDDGDEALTQCLPTRLSLGSNSSRAKAALLASVSV